MYDDFFDPRVADHFARMEGTPAVAMYRRWKAGEVLRVRTVPCTSEQASKTFEIHPVYSAFGTGLVVGATVVANGKPVLGHIGMLFSASDFLDWCTSLEAVVE